ncbi:MAG: hypothetical protein JNL90_12655 [Planctomycetes bacterium]|nr:hypothetical protein [Planctomycetota bacterium]
MRRSKLSTASAVAVSLLPRLPFQLPPGAHRVHRAGTGGAYLRDLPNGGYWIETPGGRLDLFGWGPDGEADYVGFLVQNPQKLAVFVPAGGRPEDSPDWSTPKPKFTQYVGRGVEPLPIGREPFDFSGA